MRRPRGRAAAVALALVLTGCASGETSSTGGDERLPANLRATTLVSGLDTP